MKYWFQQQKVSHWIAGALLCGSVILTTTTALAAQTLHYGDRNADVVFLQQSLDRLGYDTGGSDGNFGSGTLEAVEQFQMDNQLPADGVVGIQTWNALRSGSATSRSYSRPSAERVLAFARRFIGVPYVFGGSSPAGFDCSGFTQYVFAQSGIHLPRTADSQFETGIPVDRNHLQPGDLVFFSTYEPGASHDGIYIGDGQFINATSSRGVAVSSIYSSYWASRYVGARRILR